MEIQFTSDGHAAASFFKDREVSIGQPLESLIPGEEHRAEPPPSVNFEADFYDTNGDGRVDTWVERKNDGTPKSVAHIIGPEDGFGESVRAGKVAYWADDKGQVTTEQYDVL